MDKLRFSVDIDAPVYTVWMAMLGSDSYRRWSAAFHEGSYFEGSWDEGSPIRFLGPSPDGTVGGLVGVVEENRTHEFVSVRYLAEVDDGVETTDSPIVGVHENYSFSERDGVTTVEVELDSVPGYTDMLTDEWPKALAALKRVAEAA